MEQKNARQIKVSLGEEIRRFAFLGTSFNQLCKDVKRIFSLEEESKVDLKYQDCDKDLISVSSDEEFQTALKLVGNTLRLHLSTKPGKRLFSENITKEMKTSKDPKEKKVRVKVVKEENFSRSSITPSTQFVKTWKIRNEGEVPFPEGCTLTFHKGDIMGGPQSIPVPQVAPEQEVELSVTLLSPSSNGKYFGIWRLTRPLLPNENGESSQKTFGQPLRVKIEVSNGSTEKDSSESSSSSEEELKEKRREKKDGKRFKRGSFKKTEKIEDMSSLVGQLEKLGFTDREWNMKLLKRTRGNVDKAISKLLKKRTKSAH